ncbi:MAG: thymidine phosphorylase [Terriglobia bacterium]|jgi:pyrimidine-nucleoside phosphorylase
MNISALDVIRKKRDGNELSPAEIDFFIRGYTRGEISDAQAAAWLMAVVLRGLTRRETADLTDAMLHSGEVLDLSALSAPKVDKHSTGGVGDKTSFVLAPLAAAGGLIVPMISGRGLGHTGGTLDKYEAIPGVSVNLTLPRFREVLETCGCAIVGATAEIAPADRKLYALRNLTGTVESPFLICASIMSKKLAEGIDALVLDVKSGSGSFMKNDEDATHVANLMVETGRRMGKRIVALITDMDQPLGCNVGNALEIDEVISVLRGRGPEDLRQLCLELAGWMLYLGGRVDSVEEGKRLGAELIGSGKAFDRFRQMVALQGGDVNVVDDLSLLPKGHYKLDISSPQTGYITSIQCEEIGKASVILGAGRESEGDAVDPAVGLVLHKKVAQPVKAGEPLCTIHYNSQTRLDRARPLIEQSFQIGDAPPEPRPIVRRVIAGS